MKQIITGFILIALTLVLSACGFQPRGQNLHLQNLSNPIFISGVAQFSPLHRELSHQLTLAGVTLSHDNQTAGALLTLRDRKSRERLISVNSNNRGIEFELEESVTFSLRTAKGKQLAKTQTLSAVRLLFRPSDKVLASEHEKEQLRKDMTAELARRIIKRIAAQQ